MLSVILKYCFNTLQFSIKCLCPNCFEWDAISVIVS